MKSETRTQLTDLELTILAKGGDQEAFSALFARYYQYVINFIKQRYCLHDADEIAQITFIGAWRNIGGYDPKKGNILTWIISIATNRVIDEHRKVKRRSGAYGRFKDSLNHRPRHNGAPMFEEEVFETKAMWDDILPLISKAMERIDPHQAQALKLMLKGMTRGQIATETGAPIGTVKTRIRLGMKSLGSIIRSLVQW